MKILSVNNRKLRRDFLSLPFTIYQDYPQWVPPFEHEMRKLIRGKGSQLLANGPHEFFVAIKGKKVVGRICVGKDEELNKAKGVNHAFFTLFESVHDENIAAALMDKRNSGHRKGELLISKGLFHQPMEMIIVVY